MSDENIEEPSFGLLMPFVVVSSAGGPHEDDSFVAGYECGYIDRLLETKDVNLLDRDVHTTIVPQLDLIAMRHGYTIKWVPWEDHPDEWTRVTFTKNKEI